MLVYYGVERREQFLGAWYGSLHFILKNFTFLAVHWEWRSLSLPLLICTWFLKNRVWKIKFELDQKSISSNFIFLVQVWDAFCTLYCPLNQRRTEVEKKNPVQIKLDQTWPLCWQITNRVLCPYLKTSLPWSGPRASHDGQILHSSTHNTVPVSNILKIIDTKRQKKTAQGRKKVLKSGGGWVVIVWA